MSTFGDALRAAREARGLSQTEAATILAGALRVPVAAARMSEWERGARVPNRERQAVMLAALRDTAAANTPHIAAPAPPLPGKGTGAAAAVLTSAAARAGAHWALAYLHSALAAAYAEVAAAEGLSAPPATDPAAALRAARAARAADQAARPPLDVAE